MKTVVGLFDSTSDAQRMLEELMQMGFQADDISVVTNETSQPKVEAGAIHLDSVDLPDVGRVAASGPLRETLRRSSGTTPPLRGALERSGFPADLADRYAAGVERGGTLESLVVPDSEADRVVAAMRRRSSAEGDRKMEKMEEPTPREATSREATSAQTEPGSVEPARGVDEQQEWRIPVVREELKVGKRAVDRGGLRIDVHVVEKPVTEQIRLRETHVEVERRAVDRPLSGGDLPSFKEQTIEVAEEGEETVVSKQARIIEEVVVHKHVTDRVETVRDSLRGTEIEFGKMGAMDMARFREHFARMGTGGQYEEFEPAYRFGSELSGTGQWEEIETSARSRWEDQHPGTWERFKEYIRFGHRRKASND
jgi:uncharacterized protein (TIGR02271 family)